jgi:hypothetical protein
MDALRRLSCGGILTVKQINDKREQLPALTVQTKLH